VVKVVTDRPGPTSKADCLNTVYRRMKEFETLHGVNFDLMVMHDAEDLVHPFGFLLYNYLIPRVDVIQLPILPLPAPLFSWVHWVYADEFAENHLKDMVVREKMAGFVPFAGVGTGFSRRALAIMEARHGAELFNESSLTEDYSLGKKIKEAGLQTIFACTLVRDPQDRWYTPLCARHGFISNWSYFPMDFTRSVRQKTRWIIGISLQEWELTGWAGGFIVKLNLFKDRKVFLAATTNLLGYLVLLYFALSALGARDWLPVAPLPLLTQGSPLYYLILVDSFFMVFRVLERIYFVSMVYGLPAGLLSFPRLAFANVLNGIAAYRALTFYLQARTGGKRVSWDKTEHKEGFGQLPAKQTGETPAGGDDHRGRSSPTAERRRSGDDHQRPRTHPARDAH
jgi:adsorption protein B